MASSPLTNTSFIGDLIVIQYLNKVLNVPIIQKEIKTVSSEMMQYHCDFAVPDQRIRHVPVNLEMLIKSGSKLNEKAVVMIGSFDVLAYMRGSTVTLDSLTTDLFTMIANLWKRNVKKVILCTIPAIITAPPEANEVLEFYNTFIKNCDGIKKGDKTIKVVDLHSDLLPGGLVQLEGILPTEDGFKKMHEVLQKFL